MKTQEEANELAQELQRNSRPFTIHDFQFVSGSLLPEVTIEYTTLGTPRKDGDGAITNAVMFIHGWRSNGHSIETWKDLLAPGGALDPADYFIVAPTNLGVPPSTSPSTTGLGPSFPRYIVDDVVKALHELLTAHLGIKSLKAVMGQCGGGTFSLTFIDRYPSFAKGAVLVSPGLPYGRSLALLGTVRRAILEDPAYLEGHYSTPPAAGLSLSYMLLYPWLFSFEYFESHFGSLEEMDKRLCEEMQRGLSLDANDLVWQIECILSDPIKTRLSEINAKILVTAVKQGDVMAPLDEVMHPLVQQIPGAEIFTYHTSLGHIGCVFEIGKAGKAIGDFLKGLA